MYSTSELCLCRKVSGFPTFSLFGKADRQGDVGRFRHIHCPGVGKASKKPEVPKQYRTLLKHGKETTQ